MGRISFGDYAKGFLFVHFELQSFLSLLTHSHSFFLSGGGGGGGRQRFIIQKGRHFKILTKTVVPNLTLGNSVIKGTLCLKLLFVTGYLFYKIDSQSETVGDTKFSNF